MREWSGGEEERGGRGRGEEWREGGEGKEGWVVERGDSKQSIAV